VKLLTLGWRGCLESCRSTLWPPTSSTLLSVGVRRARTGLRLPPTSKRRRTRWKITDQRKTICSEFERVTSLASAIRRSVLLSSLNQQVSSSYATYMYLKIFVQIWIDWQNTSNKFSFKKYNNVIVRDLCYFWTVTVRDSVFQLAVMRILLGIPNERKTRFLLSIVRPLDVYPHLLA